MNIAFYCMIITGIALLIMIIMLVWLFRKLYKENKIKSSFKIVNKL